MSSGLAVASYQRKIDYCKSGDEPWAFGNPHMLEFHVNFQPVLIRI